MQWLISGENMQILTRLNPKTVNFDSIGGIAELTTADIAAALNGANKPGLSLLIKQICGEGDCNAIWEAFFPEVIRLGFRLKWRMRESEQARCGKLLQLSLYEAIDPNVCPSCRGTKYSLINPSEECGFCYGTGKFILLDQQKARYLGISTRSWRKVWRERENEIKNMLERQVYQAKQRISKNLYEDSLT